MRSDPFDDVAVTRGMLIVCALPIRGSVQVSVGGGIRSGLTLD